MSAKDYRTETSNGAEKPGGANAASDRRMHVIMLFLFMFSVVQYSYSFTNNFVWDSEGVFLNDPSIREFNYLPEYFTTAHKVMNHTAEQPKDVTIKALPYYRPLLRVVHLIEYKIFGNSPIGYNSTSIVLNAIVVISAFAVLARMTGRTDLALAASLLYAVSPVRAEAVSWAYSDSYILVALCLISTLYFYHSRKYQWSLISFAAALLFQEGAVFFIVVLFLHECLIGKRRVWKDALHIVPFALLIVFYFIVRKIVCGPVPLPKAGPAETLNSAMVVIKRYVKIFFLPDAPITIYQYRPGMFSGFRSEVVFSYGFFGVLAALGVLLWRRARAFLFWYLFFFAFILVNLIPGLTADYLMAEKILYLASLGFCTLLAGLVLSLRNKRTAYLVLSVIIAFHFSITFHKTLFWRDTETYLEKAVGFAPDFYLLHFALGQEYMKKGEYDKAAGRYLRMIALRPDLFFAEKLIASAYNEKAYQLYLAKQYDDAVRFYRRSLEIWPEQSLVHTCLGNIMYERGQLDFAVMEWKKATEISPVDPTAYYNLSLYFKKLGKTNEEALNYRLYLGQTPNTPQLSSKK